MLPQLPGWSKPRFASLFISLLPPTAIWRYYRDSGRPPDDALLLAATVRWRKVFKPQNSYELPEEPW